MFIVTVMLKKDNGDNSNTNDNYNDKMTLIMITR